MHDPLSDLLSSIEKHHRGKSLGRTPERWRQAMQFLTSGYDQNLKKIVNGALDPVEPSPGSDHGASPTESEDMVVVRDIEFYSLCEHHLLPFFGKAHVAYVPNGKIIGLSKIPRIVDMFARRLQVQERMGREVADALDAVLKPKGVGVIIEANHLCMMMRGVAKQRSTVTTSHMKGELKSDPQMRQEFLELIGARFGA